MINNAIILLLFAKNMYLFGQGTPVLLHLKLFNSTFYMLEYPVFVPDKHKKLDPLSPMYV